MFHHLFRLGLAGRLDLVLQLLLVDQQDLLLQLHRDYLVDQLGLLLLLLLDCLEVLVDQRDLELLEFHLLLPDLVAFWTN